MTAPTLSTRALNRALLARQLLLERSKLNLTQALQQIAGLQTQYAPTAYIGLWTRVEGFARDDLTRALEARDAIQATLMRSTIHVVAASDYWPMGAGIRQVGRTWWRSVAGPDARDADMEAVAQAVRGALSNAPMSASWRTGGLSERPDDLGSKL